MFIHVYPFFPKLLRTNTKDPFDTFFLKDLGEFLWIHFHQGWRCWWCWCTTAHGCGNNVKHERKEKGTKGSEPKRFRPPKKKRIICISKVRSRVEFFGHSFNQTSFDLLGGGSGLMFDTQNLCTKLVSPNFIGWTGYPPSPCWDCPGCFGRWLLAQRSVGKKKLWVHKG